MDLKKITLLFSRANCLSITRHGVERLDGAGCDLYLRFGPLVLGVPHLWRPTNYLKQLAQDKRKLLSELTLARDKDQSIARA